MRDKLLICPLCGRIFKTSLDAVRRTSQGNLSGIGQSIRNRWRPTKGLVVRDPGEELAFTREAFFENADENGGIEILWNLGDSNATNEHSQRGTRISTSRVSSKGCRSLGVRELMPFARLVLYPDRILNLWERERFAFIRVSLRETSGFDSVSSLWVCVESSRKLGRFESFWPRSGWLLDRDHRAACEFHSVKLGPTMLFESSQTDGRSEILSLLHRFTPGKIRTSDLRFRKPLLCPTELRGHLEFFQHQV